MDAWRPEAASDQPTGPFRIAPLLDGCARLRRRLDALSGWRRAGLSAALGAAAATAFPPLFVLPLLVPAFTGWLWLIAGAGGLRAAATVGWWFGFGHFLVGLYWIAEALMVEPEKFAWLIPFAIGGIAAGLAAFPAVVAAVVAATRVRGIGRVLVLAAAWGLAEWVRGWLFTGFPWNLVGTVWVFAPAMIQSAALFGTYGLGLATVTAAAVPAVLGDGEAPVRGRLAWVAAAFAVLGLFAVGGAVRLALADDGRVPGVRLRLVQPNVLQRLKWRPDLRDRHLVRQVEMSRQPAAEPPTVVIWPETSAPFFLERDPRRLAFLAGAAPEGGLVIVGAPRTTAQPESRFRVWNSLQAVDASGRIVAAYDKFHLVPFGEYVPFAGLLPITKITDGRTDFSAGPGSVTLKLPGLPPVSPLICYEIIFPGQVARRDERPAWLLNLTNDSWFGASSGPHQHLAAARMRAVEEGLPVVRAANTGISAVIDAWGRTVAGLPLGQAGVVDSPLPTALSPTPYARYGNLPFFLLAGLLAAMGLGLSRRRPEA